MKIVALEKRGLFVEVKKYLEDNILVFDGAMGTMPVSYTHLLLQQLY